MTLASLRFASYARRCFSSPPTAGPLLASRSSFPVARPVLSFALLSQNQTHYPSNQPTHLDAGNPFPPNPITPRRSFLCRFASIETGLYHSEFPRRLVAERPSHNTTAAAAESSAVAAATASSSTSRQRQDQVHQPRLDDKSSRRQPADASVTAASSSIPSSSKSSAPRPTATMPQYTSRDVGDPSQIKKNKQSMADLKLRRLTELNNRLREDLERERIPVSNASKRSHLDRTSQ
ncbi:Guanine nucleotide-binding protein subunit gamma [Colletotrichum higginsianum]|uniref:Guanine nucleotide-binding protein subunit gamma n=1 Tax=Colletotrichum higginsianum TaxID=80884 RepID=A0A4V4NCV6_9PEZI|nr:Guanine nucleotide-binding protein subunit gamma [Colletotrichum higginsianum]